MRKWVTCVMKIILRLFLLISFIWLTFTAVTYAAPSSDVDAAAKEMLGKFNVALSDIQFVNFNSRLITEESFGLTSDRTDTLSRLNTLGNFRLTKGFDRSSTTSFSNDKFLSGTGVEGTLVGLMVYGVDTKGDKNINYVSTKTVGQSGLFSELVPIELIGENFLFLAAKHNDIVNYRVFKITKRESGTKILLENIEINFINESKTQNTTPSFDVLNKINVIQF